MFLYGHMLREGDKVPYRVDGKDMMLTVLDIWESRILKETPHGTYTGSRWVELWGTLNGENRLYAVKWFGDFDGIYGVERDFHGGMQIGTSTSKYAPTLH